MASGSQAGSCHCYSLTLEHHIQQFECSDRCHCTSKPIAAHCNSLQLIRTLNSQQLIAAAVQLYHSHTSAISMSQFKAVDNDVRPSVQLIQYVSMPISMIGLFIASSGYNIPRSIGFYSRTSTYDIGLVRLSENSTLSEFSSLFERI